MGRMIIDTLAMTPEELHEQTGWELKPEGACRDDRCVPLSAEVVSDGSVDVTAFAEQLGMPIAHDETHSLWSLGPESGGRVLASATFPHLVLSDFDGNLFDFESLRGRKTLLVAWASY